MTVGLSDRLTVGPKGVDMERLLSDRQTVQPSDPL